MIRPGNVNRTRIVSITSPYDIYIGRVGQGQDGMLGNPFVIAEYGRALSLELYRVYLYRRAELDCEFRRRLLECEGKTLGCPGNCKVRGLACHGDIIIGWLDDWKSGKIEASTATK